MRNPPERGLLWWIADNPSELAHSLHKLTERGAVVVKVEIRGDGPEIDYVFELEKARAYEALGYTPSDEEWITKD